MVQNDPPGDPNPPFPQGTGGKQGGDPEPPSNLANHGKLWDGKVMGTKAFRAGTLCQPGC